jgi:4-hydroxy-tetrahydrodipicolinate synthase
VALDGLVVPVPTLFGDDGSLDPARNAKFARRLCDARVEHLFVLGSLGEFLSVEDAERARLLEAVIESLTWKTDAWIGVGAVTTARAVRYAVAAEEAGAAAVVAVPPFYLPPTEASIASYFRALHAAVGVPLLAYNIPSKVGYALTPSLVHRLAAEGTLAGMKDTAGKYESVVSFLRGAPPGFPVLPGDDPLAVQAWAAGSRGAVMGLANVVPKLGVDLIEALRAGNAPRAAELQARVVDLARVVGAGPFPSTTKFLAARLRGAEVGYRSPYDPLTPEEEATVLAALGPVEAGLRPFL